MKRVVFLLLIILININLYAYDWQSKSISLIDSTNDNGKTIDTVKDQADKVFKVSYINNPGDNDVDLVLKLKDQLYNWGDLSIDSIQFVFSSKDLLDIIIIPTKLEFDGTNIITTLPAGMLFFYTDALRYDFRMSKDGFFLRINGKFTTDADFKKKIMSAYNDPAGYLRRNDPAYLPSRVDDLEEEFNTAKLDLSLKISNLQSQLDDLKADKTRMKYAEVNLSRRGFFGGLQTPPLSTDTIGKVVKIKQTNPAFGGKEILDQIKKDDPKSTLTSGDVQIILLVYYNEYTKQQ